LAPGNITSSHNHVLSLLPIRPSAKLDQLSQIQRERLLNIDFRLYFLGSVNRNDLVSRFGMKEAAASRDLALYRDLAAKNIEYNPVIKTYIPRDSFSPLFNYTGNQALLALLYGIGDDFVGKESSLLIAEHPTQLNFPKVELLAQITRAIHKGQALKIEYLSLSSGSSERELCPFALVNNGLRWHVRGYDRAKQRFADFVINRIVKIKRPKVSDIGEPERKEADEAWNQTVELQLVPHPNLANPETIAAEYNMANGLLKLNVRASLAGYVLRRWNVDCSVDHKLKGPEVHLWLKNAHQIAELGTIQKNLVIAPNYDNDDV
jgi:hypothetical protein